MKTSIKKTFFASFMLIPMFELFYAFEVEPTRSSLLILLAYLALFALTLWLMKDISINKKYQDLSNDKLVSLAKIGTISSITSFIFIVIIMIHFVVDM